MSIVVLPAYAGVIRNPPTLLQWGEVFPAYSGLIPFRHTSAGDRCRAPCIRGGDPMPPRPPTSSGECSLHMRG